MSYSTQVPPKGEREFDAIVVGAGFAGLYTLHLLRQRGLRVLVLEAASNVGGTWFWNRYPGARCDIESVEYSFSFSEDLQQEWVWPERFASQPDILAYINHVADRFDLRRDIVFETRVKSASLDDKTEKWTIVTDTGTTYVARYCVMCVGNLSLPRVPQFPGLEDFKGEWHHTGLWPAEEVDFSGRRVGVIGTGSSGVQAIPRIAQNATHLYVFQRTANYSIPAVNRPLGKGELDEFKKGYAARRAAARKSATGVGNYTTPTQSALDVAADARTSFYEEKWTNGGGSLGLLNAYTDLIVDRDANETLGAFVREKIASIVKDPETAKLLTPNDHYIGTKRLCLDTNYFETYNRDNVSLVDVRSDPIKRIYEHGIKTTKAEYELDMIAFATGYDAMTGALLDIEISGREGVTLADKWAGGPQTYLGLMVAGFPNLFIVTGPGSPSVKTNMVAAIEQHVEWIGDCVAFMEQHDIATIEARPEKQSAWVAHVNEIADGTLFPLANSWYVGANIPGKPRVFMPYVGGLNRYRDVCNESTRGEYSDFSLGKRK